MRHIWSALLSSFVWVVCSQAAAQKFTIHPANPTSNDIIHVNAQSGSGPLTWTDVRRQSDKLVVQEFRDVGFSAGGNYSLPIGLLPAGTYRLFVQRATPSGQPAAAEEFKLEFTVTQAPTQVTDLDLEGVWEITGEPGRALYLVQAAGTLAGAVLTHDQNKRPVWYLLQGNWVTSREFRGSLFKYQGTNQGEGYSSAHRISSHVGALRLVFSSSDAATATIQLGSMAPGQDRQDPASPLVKVKDR